MLLIFPALLTIFTNAVINLQDKPLGVLAKTLSVWHQKAPYSPSRIVPVNWNLPKPRARKLSRFFVWILLWSFLHETSSGQPPLPKDPPAFSLLNLVRSSKPITVKLGTEPVGLGEMEFGFYSGTVLRMSTAPLVVEATGFPTLRVPPGKNVPGECPLFILMDGLEKAVGTAETKPVILCQEITNAKERPPGFADGLNLTSRQTLVCRIDDQKLNLEKGKRLRLTTKNGFHLSIVDGPELSIGHQEDPDKFLIVFYEDLEGKIQYAVTYDILIRQ